MNVFILQIIAMITMFCDHVADPFFNNWVVLRCIGRFAFPIYALLLAEGFRHMRNNKDKVELHLGGLITLAVISEIGYDFLEAGDFSINEIASGQSAIITLLLAFLGMIAIEKWKEDKKIWMWLTILLTAGANYMIKSNYKFAGVLLVYALYYYLDHFMDKDFIHRFAVLAAIFIIYIPIYHWARYDFCSWSGFLENLRGDNTWWYLTHVLIVFLLSTYRGELGFYSKKFKVLYRWFYPGHLFILGAIKMCMTFIR